LVASAIEDDIVNHTVLIFVGGQGIGKTTYFLSLIPLELKEYIYSGSLNPDDKDSLIHISECILVNLDELETLTKYKESALKEIITKSEIRVRRPYARYAETMNRHASLCGSVNDQSVLNDPSGSRRFLVHKVNSINYQHDVNMEQVFAQALHLFKTGFTYWFTDVEIQQVHSHNQQFEMQSVEEELLLSNYEPISSTHSAALRYTATDILKRVRQDSSGQSINHSSKIRMGQALAKHGFEHVRSSGITY
tara:strand:- start:30686 stop:31435 length:750 start_codon:yes stop_codon:yes gene_type:complete